MLKYINIRRFLFNLLFLSGFFSLTVFANTAEFKLDKLGVEEGLSQGTVRSVTQDKTGFIWVGTESGLNIYDGYSFKLLQGPNGSFDESDIKVFKQDADGLIWLNVYDQGVYTYNPLTNEYELIIAQSILEKKYYITNLIEDENKDFWISTSKVLYKYNSVSKVLNVELDLSLELPGSSNINEVIVHGKYLFLATTDGVFVYHKAIKEWRKLPSPSENKQDKISILESKVYRLHVNQNDLYIGTYISVLHLDITNIDDFFHQNNSLPNYNKLAEGLVTWEFYDDGNQLYVASTQGLALIDYKEKRLDYLFGFSEAFDNVSNNAIRSILKDNKGMLWLGSESSGLYQWKPSNKIITNYHYKKNSTKSLSVNEVWGITPHAQDPSLFWVASANGLNLVNNKNQTIESFIVNQGSRASYDVSYIEHIEYYNNHTLLLFTYDGIKLFDTTTKALVTTKQSPEIEKLFSEDPEFFTVDNVKNIWLGTSEKIYKISLANQSVKESFNTSTNIAYKDVHQDITNLLGFLPNSPLLMFSNNDSLWGLDINTNEAKLLYRHPRVNIKQFTYIDNWVIDNSNTLWLSFVGTGLIGLSLPDFSPKYHYTNANSPIDNNSYGLMIDATGDLWFSTHKGLFMMDAETHHFRKFTSKHGFLNNEFNSGAYALLDRNKFIYGGMSGVSIFDPLELKMLHAKENFTVTITNVSALSRTLDLPLTLDPKKPIKLRYDDVGISVNFSTLIYTNLDRVRYEYKLTGGNDVSYPLTFDHQITFPTLASGTHVLEIRAESPVTGEFSEPTTIKFVVSYAPWASPMAYLLYFIMLAYLIGSWLHKRQKQRAALLSAHEEVKYRENRLQLALTGSNSEVWDWQATNNLMFGKRASQDLGYVNFAQSYSFRDHVNLIHPEDKEDFLSRWQLFIHNDGSHDSFTCTYRLKNTLGEWLWYKDLGKIVEYSTAGEPTRITGSYTNITHTKASEERALYYGNAFKQTKDWVFIISDNFTRVTANKSLCDVFGWGEEEFAFSERLFGFSKEKREEYRTILSQLKENEHWKSEELIYTKTGQEYHVIVNITVSINKANNQMHYICVFSDISAQKAAEKELRYLANYDHLTNLPNRSLLLERIKKAMDYSKRKERSIALFFIDLDRFKQINDTFGHDSGDLLLQEITTRLSSALRVDDTIARIGGDEFVVLLEYFNNNAQLGGIAEKLIATVGKPVSLNGNVVSIGASIGIALYPNDAKNSDELLRNADVAMYYSKQLGRNTFQFFTQRMNYEANSRLKVEFDLKQAIVNNELINHYQPIVDSVTEKPIGFELLLRWQTPEKLIQPLKFIHIAEELGLIVEMTENAMDRGLKDLAAWREINEELFLSVNLSPSHFTKDSLVPFIKKQLLKHDLPASALKLEVTESVLISEPEKAIVIMNTLSALGILLALDDFGTGYSSLSYLKRLPLQIIKIDRTFVSGINVNNADEAIVDATIVLAKRLNMKCIAEGVDSQDQLDYLLERQCKHIQGYFYSRPLSAENLSLYLEKHNNLPKLPLP